MTARPEVTGKKTSTKAVPTVLPIRERECVTVPVASQFSGISRTRVYELLRDGVLEGAIVRGRRLVRVASLLRLVQGDRAGNADEAA